MKKYVRTLLVLFLVPGLLVLMMAPAWAATSAEKQAAIDAGLSYLASTQNADGSWSYGGYEPAATAAVLLSFVDQNYKPLGWNGQNYSTVVTKATEYLLKNTETLPFAPAGNWWGFGAGSSGIQMSAANSENTYTTGLAIPALSRLVSNPYGGAALVNPNSVVSSTNAVVNGKSYSQVIQGMVDSFTYYQSGPATGNRYGGWRYYAGNNDSDMSTAQWAPISYLFAKQVPGVKVPDKAGNAYDPAANVATGVKAWLTADQYVGGGVDYQPGAGIVNASHAGGFLVSNYFAGGGGNGGDGKADAVAWLNANWKDAPSGTWYGNEGHPYAMWAVYKGLETLYGTEGAGPITNLNPQGSNQIDPGHTWNWWEDYCQYLVLAQNGNGSWNGYDYWYGPMATAWDINILNATATQPPVVPVPAAVWLLGSGLIGLMGIRRKIKS